MGLMERLAEREVVEPSPTPVPQAPEPQAPAAQTPAAPRPSAPPRQPNQRLGDVVGEVRARVHQEVLDTLGPKLYEESGNDGIEQRVHEAIGEILSLQQAPLTAADRSQVARELADEILGHGPIEPLLRDPDVTEIMVSGPEKIFIERGGRLETANARFRDEPHLRRVIDKIVTRVGRRIDEASPMVDARLPDGSRVNAVVPPVALDGSMLTIRKFSADPFKVDDLINFGTLTAPVAELLRACVKGRLNLVISGGTGSGKTTTLNVLSSFIPADERIVTIEDAAELQLHQEHVLRMESRPANIEGRGEIKIRDLVRNSLRMRPDRIVVGEVRDGAALDMLQAMNTGHDGSLTTAHANTPRDMLARLETMVLMAGMDLPVRAIREQIASAIDVIVQVARLKDGSRRITHITECLGMEGDVITLQDLFLFDYRAGLDGRGRYRGSLVSTGLRPRFLDKLIGHGISLPPEVFSVAGGHQ